MNHETPDAVPAPRPARRGPRGALAWDESQWIGSPRLRPVIASPTAMKIALLLLLVLDGVAAARPPLIVTGWDSPSPEQYRQHLAEFERWGVFDGTTIRPTRRDANSRDVDARFAFSREPWRWEEFTVALADLRRPTHDLSRDLPHALRESGRRGLVR